MAWHSERQCKRSTPALPWNARMTERVFCALWPGGCMFKNSNRKFTDQIDKKYVLEKILKNLKKVVDIQKDVW